MLQEPTTAAATARTMRREISGTARSGLSPPAIPTYREHEIHELARARRSSCGPRRRPDAPAPAATRARARRARPRADPRRPRSGRAPCRSPGRRARTSRARAAPRRRPATAAPTAARGRAAAHSSSATCGAYGWISETAVSAAKRAAGSSRRAVESSFTSSITAAIGVLNWKRRPMSSLTRAIVSCALRASAPSPRSLDAARARATSSTTRQRRRTKRDIPSMPSSRPLHVLVGRAHEEDVEPHRVGAVRATSVVRPRDVALRLRHLRAAHLHPALVEEARERLAEADHARGRSAPSRRSASRGGAPSRGRCRRCTGRPGSQ